MTALMVGLATVDLAYLVEDYPAEDSKTTAADQTLAAGGPAANAAVTYAVLSGRSPMLLSALGGHPLAGIARADLAAHHVSVTDVTPDADHPPAVSSIVVSRSAQSRTIVSRDGSDIRGRFHPRHATLLDAAQIVLLDGHHPELAIEVAARARQRGIPIVLDAGRRKPIHDRLIPLADVVICSAGFQPPAVRDRDTDRILAYLHESGVRHAAITNGAQPIRFSSRHEPSADLPVPKIPAVDTLGAGDALHGAFCHYHLNGEPFPAALAHAARVASETCRYFGPRRWITASPDHETTARESSTTR